MAFSKSARQKGLNFEVQSLFMKYLLGTEKGARAELPVATPCLKSMTSSCQKIAG